MGDKKLLTVKEVSEVLHVNVNFVHKLRKAGLIKFLKLGCYKCRTEALDNFLKSYEGYDITDPFNIKVLTEGGGEDGCREPQKIVIVTE